MIIDSRATSTDTDALLVMLQSACASVLDSDSVYGLVGIKVSSAGHSVIIIKIHVASEEEQL